jgi:hypothetical protein
MARYTTGAARSSREVRIRMDIRDVNETHAVNL